MSIEIIILAAVGIVCALMGFGTGKKVEAPRAEKRGKERAVNEIQKQTTEQTFEKVVKANEAARTVERADPSELREQTRNDPNNRGRVQRS